MKPGVTTCPAASTTRRASPPRPGPRAAMRSPSTATSARCRGAPVPSTTSPPRITRSQATSRLHDAHGPHPVTLPDAVHVLHAGHDLAEDGVAAVEMRLGTVGDVE